MTIFCGFYEESLVFWKFWKGLYYLTDVFYVCASWCCDGELEGFGCSLIL